MPPKPFPFPLGIGIDVVKISRLAGILKDEKRFNQWARRVFSRLEWPQILHACQPAARQIRSIDGTANDSNHHANTRQGPTSFHSPVLPDVWAFGKIHSMSEVTFNLAQFLAGRWALKEAVLKAHRNRTVQYRQISVMKGRTSLKRKPIVLVDPPCRDIAMDSRVAVFRGLESTNRPNMQPGAFLAERDLTTNPNQDIRILPAMNRTFIRSGLVKAEDRQIVEANLSHDGGYAVAVCMAIDETRVEDDMDSEQITDDGSGDPIHEPLWGDKGFCEKLEDHVIEEE